MSNIESMPANRPFAETYPWGEQLVEELTGFEYESRAYPRTKLTADIVVRATNGLGSVFGAPCNVITTDISAGGIGFLHTTAIPDKFLAITLGPNGRRIFFLVEVVRCRAVGKLYEVGVKFIRPLNNVES